jgi:hypothetical protein
LSAEFATDPPSQPTLAGAAGGQCDRKLRGYVEIFGDYLHASVRHVRDRTIARQASPELDPREASAMTTFAFASIQQHVDPSPCSIMLHTAFQPLLAKNHWNLPSGIARNVANNSDAFYGTARTKAAGRAECGPSRQDSSASSMASNSNGAWKPGSAVTLLAQSATLAQRLRSNAQISANAASP